MTFLLHDDALLPAAVTRAAASSPASTTPQTTPSRSSRSWPTSRCTCTSTLTESKGGLVYMSDNVSGQFYKAPTIVINVSRVVIISNLLVSTTS